MKITFHIQPGAKKNEINGKYGGLIKVKVAAPPTDNAANNELIAFIAKTLNIPKSAIKIVRGQTSRTKTLEIATGLEESKVLEMLESFFKT